MKQLLVIALALTLTLAASAQAPFRLVSEQRHQELVSLIPQTDDPVLESIRTDSRLIVYTRLDMRRASQFWDTNPLAGVHDADWNISANPKRLPGNRISGGPGQEFPWQHPFGIDHAEGVETFKFLWLPPQTAIRWYQEQLSRDGPQSATYRWSFPVGTIFGEVLSVTSPEGWSKPFELRVRRKLVSRDWRPDVLRPVADRAEYDHLVPEAKGQGQQRTVTLRNDHPRKIIDSTGVEDVLPPLAPGRVKELLARTFRSVRDRQWVAGGHAPGSDSQFHIVPRGYTGAAVAVSTASCARCHRTALQAHPGEFGPFGRDWYGRVPGDDQTISFHVFDPASVSSRGVPQFVSINQRMVKAGILKHWDQE